jgi:hypothetical protein
MCTLSFVSELLSVEVVDLSSEFEELLFEQGGSDW